MNARERILAGVVGAAVVLFGGWRTVRWVVVQPLEGLNKAVEQAGAKKASLERFVERHGDVVKRWEDYTARTFSANVEEARVNFLSEVATLLDAHQLTQERSITPRTPRKQKSGLIEVSLQIRVKGSLKSVIGFMRELRQRPFLERLSSVSMRSTEDGRAGKARRRGRAARADAELAVSMVATTLVLPQLGGTRHRPAAPQAQPPARLARAPEAYDEIARVNFFQKYRKPPPPRPEPSTQAIAKRRDMPPPAPAVVRPDMVVVGVCALNGVPRAYVRDEDHREQPLVEYFVDDEVDDGKLVLVHPKGIVVRVAKRTGGKEQATDYFYPVGSNFRERLPLAQADPEVVRGVPPHRPEQSPPPNAPRPTAAEEER